MRPARSAAVVVLAAAFLSVPQPAQAAVFKHPGVLVSRAQLDFVRANLDREPWRAAWRKLQRHSFASLSYTPTPAPSWSAARRRTPTTAAPTSARTPWRPTRTPCSGT
ncbi:hypothetical protein ACFQ0B_16595 [Nonomuraea thailandensis]